MESYKQFILEQEEYEQDLYKVYLTIDSDSGHRWWTYKGFAGSKYFVQINKENIDEVNIDPDYPVLCYNSKITNKLLDSGKIREINIYNKPEEIKVSGSKELFHKKFEGDSYLPKTVYSKEEAIDLGFPLIAKPANGHSGIGIEVLKNEKEFEKADHSKFDLYSEFIDKKEEHRIFIFKGNPFMWMEREPMNEKSKTGEGEGEEKMDFKYIKRNRKNLPPDVMKLINHFSSKLPKLEFLTLDVMLDKNNKAYLIETNTQPGVPFDSTVLLYRQIFKDFFNKELTPETDKKLKEYSKYLDDKTLELNTERFEIK